MTYLQRLPRRLVTVYLPLAVFVFVLLFPFYWMAITAIKPNDELTDYKNFSPFWVVRPTFDHIRYLLFETSYPGWLLNTILISVAATILSLFASVFAAYAIERLRFKGAQGDWPCDLSGLSRSALDPLHSPCRHGLQSGSVRYAVCTDPDLSDIPHTFLHLAADGLFPLHPL